MAGREAATSTGRTIAIAALIAAALVVGMIAIATGGEDGHRLTVTVPEATNVVVGQQIRAGGTIVGDIRELTPIRGGRAAKIEMQFHDEVWPLTRGTKLALRWGGTANYSNRYIRLYRGPDGAPPLSDGGTFPAKDFAIPVEFDALLRTFPKHVRADVRGFLDSAGPAFQRARDPLRRTLDAAPPAIEQASFVLRDLDADKAALRTLVVSADGVVDAVDRAQPGVRSLLQGASETFAAIGDQAADLQQTLDLAPRTFARVRATLGKADRTLGSAGEVTRRLAPGVAEVQRIVAPLNRVLATVTEVGPDAEATLATARRAVPSLNPLLQKVTERSPQLASISRQAVDNLGCIRPYTPDVMSFFSNWGDFHSLDDGKDKMIRAQVQNFLPAYGNTSTYNSGQAAKLFPGLEYGFPRPPGTNAGQPWFLPECGAGPDALDPQKDPEARPFGDIMKLPPLQSPQRAFRGRR